MRKQKPHETDPAKIEAQRVKRQQERADRFARIAPARMTKLAKAMQAVAHFGNPQTYNMTEEQRDKIVEYARSCYDSMLDELTRNGKAKDSFSL